MRRRIPILAAAAAAVLIAVPIEAQAHDGEVTASCAGITVHLTNYPAGGTITGAVDGKQIGLVMFEHSYDNTVPWDSTVNHSYDLTVTASDNYPTKHFSQEVTGCVPNPSPTPSDTPSTTPTPTETPSAPDPSETPKPPVTTPQQQPSAPSTPNAAPSTPQSTPSAPSVEKPTEAPVPAPVVAPATFTG